MGWWAGAGEAWRGCEAKRAPRRTRARRFAAPFALLVAFALSHAPFAARLGAFRVGGGDAAAPRSPRFFPAPARAKRGRKSQQPPTLPHGFSPPRRPCRRGGGGQGGGSLGPRTSTQAESNPRQRVQREKSPLPLAEQLKAVAEQVAPARPRGAAPAARAVKPRGEHGEGGVRGGLRPPRVCRTCRAPYRLSAPRLGRGGIPMYPLAPGSPAEAKYGANTGNSDAGTGARAGHHALPCRGMGGETD
jgi:hypothetical protein